PLSISIKTIINKNGNKIFRKKIFQLLLIISIKQVIKYIYKDVYYVCPLSISIKTIINKNGNKIFRKKNIPTFINYFYKDVYYVCPLSISIKTIINKNGHKIFRKKIFQLSLIISIRMFIMYVHYYIY